MFEFIDDSDEAERCGLLITNDIDPVPHGVLSQLHVHTHVDMVVELPNRHEDPTEYFRITQTDIDHAMEWLGLQQDQLMGFWHTHPGEALNGPSQEDWDAITLGEKTWWHCVYHVHSRTLTWFDYYDNEITQEVESHGRVQVPIRAIRIRSEVPE